MSILKQVVKGRLNAPYLVLIYGVEGIGKTTFAAYSPNPIFLGTERGSSFLDVARFPKVEDFDGVMKSLQSLLDEDHNYKSLVIDSLDWLEPIVHKKVLADKGKGKTAIEDIGFAKGYVWALDYWRQILKVLDEIRSKKGMNIILTGHSIVKTFHDPNLTDGYERYQLKLHDKASALVKEFVDFVLFATFEATILFDEGKKNRARGEGKRLLHTQHRPSFDAKSRIAIPFTISLSWKAFDFLCQKVLNEGTESLVKRLQDLSGQIGEEVIREKVLKNINENKNNMNELKAIEIQILNIIA